MNNLAMRRCKDASDKALPEGALIAVMPDLPGWNVEDKAVTREWKFANHYEVMAFVNAIAWISHHEDHHPDMLVGFNTVKVSYFTHSACGVTEKDLICAAKVGELI